VRGQGPFLVSNGTVHTMITKPTIPVEWEEKPRWVPPYCESWVVPYLRGFDKIWEICGSGDEHLEWMRGMVRGDGSNAKVYCAVERNIGWLNNYQLDPAHVSNNGLSAKHTYFVMPVRHKIHEELQHKKGWREVNKKYRLVDVSAYRDENPMMREVMERQAVIDWALDEALTYLLTWCAEKIFGDIAKEFNLNRDQEILLRTYRKPAIVHEVNYWLADHCGGRGWVIS
jgi:hypothetical protein